MNTQTEIDLLEMDVGGVKIKDMSTLTFFQWVAKKIDGVSAYSASSVELRGLVSNPPMSRFYPEDQKIAVIKKIQGLGVII
jgi:hypothetical protein